jgi:alpha-1,2-mannosyltransferase
VVPIAPLAYITHKSVLFYALRVVFAIVFAIAGKFIVGETRSVFGVKAGNALLVFLACAPGVFAASTSFLPQSFAMYLVMLAFGFWLKMQRGAVSGRMVVVCLGIACLIGWPFAGILAIVPGVYIVWRDGFVKTLVFGGFVAVGALGSSILVDWFYYRKFAVAIWNIIAYNRLLGEGGKGGADIYGVEPPSFYFINLFLNLNVVFLLFLAFPVILAFHFVYHKRFKVKMQERFYLNRFMISLGAFMFFIVFLSMDHKEERFFYPLYPIICLVASLSLELTQEIAFPQKNSKYLRSFAAFGKKLLLLGFFALSISRIASVCINYGAPLKIFTQVSKLESKSSLNVCMGKEWYRFPNSFFLPEEDSSHESNLLFIRSGFDGQLPQPFARSANATSQFAVNFNDRNKEEVSRYSSIEKCDYIVDWDIQNSRDFQEYLDSFTVVSEFPFLDATHSPSPWRAFYIPFISQSKCKYQSYVLLKRIK